MTDCMLGARRPSRQWLPLAVTVLGRGRADRHAHPRPDADAGEQVPFALAARDGKLATAGFVARKNSRRHRAHLPRSLRLHRLRRLHRDLRRQRQTDPPPRLQHGPRRRPRCARWLPDDIVAVGSSGWDRWQGGNSISRGADPLIVWLSPDGAPRRAHDATDDGGRHFNLFDVTVTDRSIVANGFSDAPMTHSGDGGNTAARTFGPLRVRLDRR